MMFWWWVISDLINYVVDLIKNFFCASWDMTLQFSRTDLIDVNMRIASTFNWTFAVASVWRTAFTFTIVSSWMIFLCIILVFFITIEVNFLDLDWVDLPATIVAIVLDYGGVERCFDSNWRLGSSEKRFSERTDYFRHQNFFIFGIVSFLVRILMWLHSCLLVKNSRHLAQTRLSSKTLSWLLESLVELLILIIIFCVEWFSIFNIDIFV